MVGPERVYLRLASATKPLEILAILLPAALLSCLPLVAAQDDPPSEVTSQESTPTFRMQVERNLVLVRVVVRDSKGKVVDSLRKEDFRLFDNGKPQAIVHFAAEAPASIRALAEPPSPETIEEELEVTPETTLAPSTPTRFLALFFDNVHMKFEDLARTRQAAERYLASSLTAGDRVGIFTSTGENELDFTDDQEKLRQALLRLMPRSIVVRDSSACPDVFDYQAYVIVHGSDPDALEIATQEAFQCNYEGLNMDPEAALRASENIAMREAFRIVNAYQTETEYALRAISRLVRRMAFSPGQRSVVLVSPGFLTVSEERRMSELAERALRSNVVINTLDAKGLYVAHPLGDASKAIAVLPRRADLSGKKARMALEEMSRAADVLRNLAYDTGGEYFHNSNDLDEGFRKVGNLAEYYYVLGFSPQNLKYNGRLHSLKVRLAKGKGLKIQARSGYYAPDKPQDAVAQAKEEVEQALFSHDELNELPIEVHTQFFKLNDLGSRLAVLTRLDLRFVSFRKEGGRNLNTLKLVTGLFDRDGKYVEGKIKDVELRLLDGSLEKLSQSGLTTKVSFDVEPGTYTVRQVVRDSEGAHISALNRTVVIPF
jgi:VWFA-related protein